MSATVPPPRKPKAVTVVFEVAVIWLRTTFVFLWTPGCFAAKSVAGVDKEAYGGARAIHKPELTSPKPPLPPVSVVRSQVEVQLCLMIRYVIIVDRSPKKWKRHASCSFKFAHCHHLHSFIKALMSFNLKLNFTGISYFLE